MSFPIEIRYFLIRVSIWRRWNICNYNYYNLFRIHWILFSFFFFFFLCTHLQITLNLKFSRRIFQITSIFPIEEIFDIVNVKFSQNRNRTIAISKFHVLGNKKNLSAETNAQKNFCIKSQRETLTRIVTTPRNNVPSRNYPYRVIDLTTLRTNCDPGLLFERNVSPGLPYTLITA